MFFRWTRLKKIRYGTAIISRITMRPILYFDDRSPPARSCLLLIKMLDIDVECKFVDLFEGDQFRDDFLKINPTHTVPTLVHDDLLLTDSHSILMHLCDTFALHKDSSALFPKEYKVRMRIIDRLLFECSILFRRDSDMMSEIFLKGFGNVDLEYHKRKIFETYSIMELFLMGATEEQDSGLQRKRFMAGENLTIADISLLTTLSTVDMMFPIEGAGCNTKWTLLSDWLQRMKALPEYQINREGLEKLRTVMEVHGKVKFPTSKVSDNIKSVEEQ